MTRYRPALCVFALFFGVVWHGSAHAETVRYYVTLDQARVLRMPDAVTKVSLANPGIADVMVLSPQQLLITAKSVGQTSLLLFHANGMTSYDLIVHTPPISEAVRVNPDSEQFHSVLVHRADRVTSQIFGRDTEDGWVELGTVRPATEAKK
jgi:Flp pilus assembly secretin CpaC